MAVTTSALSVDRHGRRGRGVQKESMSSEGQQPRMTVTAARTGADFEAGRGADRNGEAPVGIVPNDRREEQPATGLGAGGGGGWAGGRQRSEKDDTRRYRG